MPTIHKISVYIENPKPVYRPGDEIKGQWTVNTGETFSVKAVSVSLHGAAFTRWENTERKADDNKGYESITSQERVVFSAPRSGDTVDYPAGKYVYKFSFKLPRDMVPSTYEGKHGAIRYWLSFDIERPLLRMHITRIKVLTVLADIDVNIPEYSKFVGRKTEKTVSKALGFGNQGAVTLTAQTDRGAYCPGEMIFIKYIAENKSEKDLGRIRIDLMQKVRFRASGSEKYKYQSMGTIFGEDLKKGANVRSVDNRYAITVPAVPPTTMERTSHIIKVQYIVKVVVDIPKINGGDATVLIPITLGTIPQGHKAKPEPEVTGASNIPVIDASSAITYTQCTDGFEDGSMIYDDLFPRFTYIPWCTYVPDFKQPVKKPVTPQAKAPAKPTKNDADKSTPPQKQPNLTAATQQPMPQSQCQLQPTAPPMHGNPPSYEDVLKEMESIPVQKPEESNGYGINAAEEDSVQDVARTLAGSPANKSGVMVIRFADTCLKQFRDALRRSAPHLVKLGGRPVAVSPQVMVTKGSWPKQTSIAVLSFENFDTGPLWYSTFKQSSDAQGVDILDCSMLKGSDEDCQNEKSFFSISLSKVDDTTSAEYKNMLKGLKEVFKPILLEHGGTSICAAKVGSHLADNEMSDHKITISQWDAVKQYSDYKTYIKTNAVKYKDLLIMFAKYNKVETTAMFQTEDLSYLTEETTS